MKRDGKSRKKSNAKKLNKSLSNKKNNFIREIISDNIRLNKFIANTGICSRREADKFIEAGVVTVNGIGITKMGYKVTPSDIVKFNNQTLKSEVSKYIVLNKPKDYSGRVHTGTKTSSVMSLVASSCKEMIYPADRLNKSEMGVLIFTNDHNLAKKINDNNQKIKSIYHITLNKTLTQKDLEKIKTGIRENGKTYTLDAISYIKNQPKNKIGIENSKGGIKYIHELFSKLNYNIILLDRVFFGGLTKKNLPRKHYRHLTEKEINILKRL